MNKAAVALLAIPLLKAQAIQHLVGYVTDTQGNPVSGASVVFAGRQNPVTDAGGRFELDTNAPAIVIRKSGYRSEFVRLDTANVPRITIQKLKETLVFPTCASGANSVGIKGFSARLRFRKVRGITVGRQGVDIDFATRFYYVQTPVIKIQDRERGILHGAGPLWGHYLSDQEFWRLRTYDETDYVEEGSTDIALFDARGAFENGNRWRYLGGFHEDASYSNVDEATAKLLDKMLDTACLAPLSRP